jgi:hypothetical protein
MELAWFSKRMRGAVVLLVVCALAVFADIPHSLDRPLGPRKEIRLSILAAPARIGNDTHMLRREDHDALTQCDAAVIRHRIGD